MFLVGCFFLSSYHFILLKMSIKIAASMELVFRLRSCFKNDTMCLLRTSVSFRSVPPLLEQGRYFNYLIPSIFPTLFLRPCLVVGIPVALAIFLFADVTPVAFLQLNDNPGIPLFFLAIISPPFYIFSHLC